LAQLRAKALRRRTPLAPRRAPDRWKGGRQGEGYTKKRGQRRKGREIVGEIENASGTLIECGKKDTEGESDQNTKKRRNKEREMTRRRQRPIER